MQSFMKEVHLKNIVSCEIHLAQIEKNIIHHYSTEESQLFSKVFDNPKLKEGGAFCTYYFDIFMNRRPLTQLMQLLKKIKPNFQEPKPSSENEKYFILNSPLSIPCEEHLVILALIQELKIELKSNRQIDWNWIELAVPFLMSWIKTNHEKEENCLFPHLQALLSNES